ncbi:MAG TPA: APC family permease [Candidatus Kapabacteria bacterium]|nr:APC family permease [Candidatus Kapabacteria bacterium]
MSIHNNDSDTISIGTKIKYLILGNPKNINDPGIFHKIALVPFLAWIGLGADGLSSSSYGPEEAFRALGQYSYLGIFLAIATMLTVTIISYSYSKLIEHFPNGGGGYVVASSILGHKMGLISGSALIIDYILTVTVSIVSCTDAIFSYFPKEYHYLKLYFASILIILLILLNLRGTKESIKILMPIFILFLLTHIFMISYGILSHLGNFNHVFNNVETSLNHDINTIGTFGVIMIFLRAYSIGGGTYTGIEAVSNGLQIMREPKVKSGKRTMLYMAVSLSLAAGGLYTCYVLNDIQFVPGKTLNAALAANIYGGSDIGLLFAFLTIFSEGALLFVAAQAGFIDAPRIMANMSLDGWLPRQFATFTEQLTMKNGIIIIGLTALVLLFYTEGSISQLVIMYSINVFITFTISHFAMVKYYNSHKDKGRKWLQDYLTFIIGLIVSATILFVILFEKFLEGGWVTIVITAIVVGICILINKHYTNVRKDLVSLEENIDIITMESYNSHTHKTQKSGYLAAQLVGNYDGFGIHTFLNIIKSFNGIYDKIVFISVVVVDQNILKNNDTVETLVQKREIEMKKYVLLANKLGLEADYKIMTGTYVPDSVYQECRHLFSSNNNLTVFTGKLIFRNEKFFHKYLHNETTEAVQKKLNFEGITNVVIPIKIRN